LHTGLKDYTQRYLTSPLGGEFSYDKGVRKNAITKNVKKFQKLIQKLKTSFLFYDGAHLF